MKISSYLAGPKCGIPQVWSPMVHSLRVVGGAEATYGSHPWLVSGEPFFFEHFKSLFVEGTLIVVSLSVQLQYQADHFFYSSCWFLLFSAHQKKHLATGC